MLFLHVKKISFVNLLQKNANDYATSKSYIFVFFTQSPNLLAIASYLFNKSIMLRPIKKKKKKKIILLANLTNNR